MTLDDVDRKAVLTAFADDASSRADRIERVLAELRTTSGEPAREAAATLDDEAHGIRGAAATVALDDIVEAARELERALAAWEPGTTEVPGTIVARVALLVELLRAVRVEQSHPDAPASPESPGVESAVVLHIEDNASNLKLVERILDRRAGVELHEARTGGDGLALAAELRPSLVVLDLRLPDMSGEEVLLRLRADSATRGIPVVVISAEARPAEADRVLAAGADDFLVKPIDMRTFLEVVDRMLARARS